MYEKIPVSTPNFVVDWNSMTRDTGHTIDWSKGGGE